MAAVDSRRARWEAAQRRAFEGEMDEEDEEEGNWDDGEIEEEEEDVGEWEVDLRGPQRRPKRREKGPADVLPQVRRERECEFDITCVCNPTDHTCTHTDI